MSHAGMEISEHWQTRLILCCRFAYQISYLTQLKKAHPEEQIRPPPAKDRTHVAAPTSPTAETSPGFQNGSAASPTNTSFHPNRLAREKNRLTLRAYLHSLLASSAIASSPVLRSFLISAPTTLTPTEVEDAKKREEADNTRENGRKKFAREIAARVEGLRDAVKSVKGDLMGQGG